MISILDLGGCFRGTECLDEAREHDKLLRLALTKLIEIVAEAAKQVSNETGLEYPNVPWSAASRMRDRLIHHYFDIDLDVLWDTVREDLPPLLGQLDPPHEVPSWHYLGLSHMLPCNLDP
jgi:uncharacterized protein with HEPN domain